MQLLPVLMHFLHGSRDHDLALPLIRRFDLDIDEFGHVGQVGAHGDRTQGVLFCQELLPRNGYHKKESSPRNRVGTEPPA
jgi:hypothetical protein